MLPFSIAGGWLNICFTSLITTEIELADEVVTSSLSASITGVNGVTPTMPAHKVVI